MNGPKPLTVLLSVIGTLFLGWAIVKASIIGYYDNEIVPQLLIPGLIGFGALGLAKLVGRSSD
jgi:hypothetical protein